MATENNQMAETGIIAALAKALPKLEGAKKNAANPHFKSKYADLGAVIDALEPIIEHGLWYRQQTHDHDEGAMIETFYIHTSGEEKSAGTLFMPATKKDAQAFGSALTYARRYGLQCAFGLATEDDDANAAVAGAKRETAKPAVINDGQWAVITDLIEKTSTDAKAFCTAFKIKSVKDLPADAFDKARSMLNKKLEKAAQTTSEAIDDEIKY